MTTINTDQPPHYQNATRPGHLSFWQHAWVRWFAVLFLVTWAVFLLHWIAYFPGTIPSDAADQWSRLHGPRPLNNWHPYVHTLWLGVLHLGTQRVEVSVLMQLTLMAVLLAALSTWLIVEGVPGVVMGPLHLLLTLNPAVGVYSTDLAKDTATAMFVLFILLCWLIITRRDLQTNWRTLTFIVSFAITTAVLIGFRHNHLLFAPLIVLMVVFTRLPRPLKVTFVCVLIGVMILINIPLRLGWVESSSRQTDFAKLWLLTFSYQTNSASLDEDERALLRVLVQGDVLETVPCTGWDQLTHGGPNTTTERWQRRSPAVMREVDAMLMGEVTGNPGALVAQRLCTFIPTLGFPPSRATFARGTTDWATSEAVRLGLDGAVFTSRPLHAGLHDFMWQLHGWFLRSPQRHILFNHTPALLLVIAGGLYAIDRRRWALVGSVLIFLYFVLSILAFGVSPQWRYLLFLYMGGLYMLPLILLPPSTHHQTGAVA